MAVMRVRVRCQNVLEHLLLKKELCIFCSVREDVESHSLDRLLAFNQTRTLPSHIRLRPMQNNDQKCENHIGRYLLRGKDVEAFPKQVSELCPSRSWQYVGGNFHPQGLRCPIIL